MKHDYLAIIYIGGGSSWGRAPVKETAIKNAITALRDWRSLFKVADVEVTVNVVDVTGYGQVTWSHHGFDGVNEKTGKDEHFDPPVELVKRTTPKWRFKN
jgi:hypothetical protein